MAPRTKKAQAKAVVDASGPASARQTYALWLYTRKDYRNEGLTSAEASVMLSALAHKANLAKLAKGEAVSVKFEADAKRLFDALKGKGVRCALKSGAWVFTPPASALDPDGFPTR